MVPITQEELPFPEWAQRKAEPADVMDALMWFTAQNVALNLKGKLSLLITWFYDIGLLK